MMSSPCLTPLFSSSLPDPPTHKMGLLPMPALTGTYDVLTVPLLLPVKTVESLLPIPYQNCSPSLLLPTPEHFLTAIPRFPPNPSTNDSSSEQYHLVLLQLGHQKNTGPGPFKMTFQEAKLEVPFVRHPKAHEGDKKKEFLFKQKWCVPYQAPCVRAWQWLTTTPHPTTASSRTHSSTQAHST